MREIEGERERKRHSTEREPIWGREGEGHGGHATVLTPRVISDNYRSCCCSHLGERGRWGDGLLIRTML